DADDQARHDERDHGHANRRDEQRADGLDDGDDALRRRRMRDAESEPGGNAGAEREQNLGRERHQQKLMRTEASRKERSSARRIRADPERANGKRGDQVARASRWY